MTVPSYVGEVHLYFGDLWEEQPSTACEVLYQHQWFGDTFGVTSDHFGSTSWMTPGSGNAAGVGECGVLATSSGSISGGTMTVNFAMKFNPNFFGSKTIWAAADWGPWQNMGSWSNSPIVFGTGDYGSIDYKMQVSGSGNTATFTVSMLNGQDQTSGLTFFQAANSLNPSNFANSCVVVLPGFGGTGSLYNDAGTSNGVSSNSQCTLTSASMSPWVFWYSFPTSPWNGSYYPAFRTTYTFTLTASSTYTGMKSVFGKSGTYNGPYTTGWLPMATWDRSGGDSIDLGDAERG